jgi:hypothetical protein
MQPVKSWIDALLAAISLADGPAGRNDDVTVCNRNTFINFGGWISKNLVKPSQTKSNLIQPNPTRKSDQIRLNPTLEMAWTVPGWLKTGMEACNP